MDTINTQPTSTTPTADNRPRDNRPRDQRAEEAVRFARTIFEQGPDWVTFLREVMGVNGTVRGLFVQTEELAWFEKSEYHAEIQHMVAQLRNQVVATTDGDDKEPTKVITVRLPKSLHELLRKEAHEHSTSMNKLCISKLLQVINDEFIPSDVAGQEKVEMVRVDPPHTEPSGPHQTASEQNPVRSESPRAFG